MAKANFCRIDRLSPHPAEDFKSFCFGHKTFPNRGHEHTNEDRALLLPLDALLDGVMVRRTHHGVDAGRREKISMCQRDKISMCQRENLDVPCHP